jgi:hypothetical protein
MKLTHKLLIASTVLGVASILTPGLTNSASAQASTTFNFGGTVDLRCTYMGIEDGSLGYSSTGGTPGIPAVGTGTNAEGGGTGVHEISAWGQANFDCNSNEVTVATTITGLDFPTAWANATELDDPTHHLYLSTHQFGAGAQIAVLDDATAVAVNGTYQDRATGPQGNLTVYAESIWRKVGEELPEGDYAAIVGITVTAETTL